MTAFLTNIIIINERFRKIKDAIEEFSKLQLFAYALNFSASTVFNFFFVKISLMFAKVAVTIFRSRLFKINLILINEFERRMLKRAMTATFRVSEFTILLLIIISLNISFFKLKSVVVFSSILFLTFMFSVWSRRVSFSTLTTTLIFSRILYSVFSMTIASSDLAF